jgi:hypothetical protein
MKKVKNLELEQLSAFEGSSNNLMHKIEKFQAFAIKAAIQHHFKIAKAQNTQILNYCQKI